MNILGLDSSAAAARASQVLSDKKLVINSVGETVTLPVERMKDTEILEIVGSKIHRIPDTIGDFEKLRRLTLACPLEALPEALARLENLESLYINHCILPSLPDFLGDLVNLREFHLVMANSFEGTFASLRSFPSWIANFKNLKSLALDYTYIRRIPDFISDLPLERLFLNGGSWRGLPETLGKLRLLKKLVLYSWKLDTLPAWLGDLSSLEDCSLRGVFETLPHSIGGLGRLKELNLDSPRLREIPASLGRCQRLETLLVESAVLKKIPGSICSLKNLRLLFLDAKTLETLPAALGDLPSLKELRVESYALRGLPESTGRLKKLASLNITAPQLARLPASFANLAHIKSLCIASLEPLPLYDTMKASREKRRNPMSRFDKTWAELKKLYQVDWGIFHDRVKKYSVRQIEELIVHRDKPWRDTKEDKELVKNVFSVRYMKLRRTFKWSEENTKRIVRVSDKFLEAWEKGFAEAKAQINTLYARRKIKDTFPQDYEVKVRLTPQILLPNPETGKLESCEFLDENIYSRIVEYMDPDDDESLTIYITPSDYDPKTGDDRGLREDIHVSRHLSWNIEGFGDIALDGHYICYALHVLYSHLSWAPQDIMKINRISIDVEMTLQHESRVF